MSSRLTQNFSGLSAIDRALLIQADMAASVDTTVSSAKVQMKSVPLPTYFVDIFRKSILEDAKALFSPLFKEDPTPGFGFSALRRRCTYTLEGYFVDKHLSHHISSKFMTEVLIRIEQAVNKQLQGGNDAISCFNRYLFHTKAIDSFGVNGDNFVQNFREVNIEVAFMLRILERLRIQEETNLFQELPLPQFSNPSNLEQLNQGMLAVQSRGGLLTVSCSIPETDVSDCPLYERYLTQLFDERDRRILKILKEAFQKDLAVREKNPKAPLVHLVTIESYEKKIGRQRRELCTKIAIAAFAVFFFTTSCIIRRA
jgi:hypothetical protein